MNAFHVGYWHQIVMVRRFTEWQDASFISINREHGQRAKRNAMLLDTSVTGWPKEHGGLPPHPAFTGKGFTSPNSEPIPEWELYTNFHAKYVLTSKLCWRTRQSNVKEMRREFTQLSTDNRPSVKAGVLGRTSGVSRAIHPISPCALSPARRRLRNARESGVMGGGERGARIL